MLCTVGRMTDLSRTDNPQLRTENKSLHGDEDKTAVPFATPPPLPGQPAADPAVEPVPDGSVSVTFDYHHAQYEPGDTDAVPIAEARRLVAARRAHYAS